MSKKSYLILLVLSVLMVYSSMTCKSSQKAVQDSKEEKASGKVYNEKSLKNQENEEPKNVEKDGNQSREIMYGLYLNNLNSRNSARLDFFIQKAKDYGFNAFIMDVQRGAYTRMVSAENVDKVKQAGIFPVARVVVFPGGGLKRNTVSEQKIQSVIKIMKDSQKAGFSEIQLDYIRYADEARFASLGLQYKYRQIEKILSAASQKAKELNVRLGSDVFGRVTLNQNDHIGQKLENFAKYMDVIYPMLYPSHYGADQNRMSHPYETVKEGVASSKKRVPDTKIIAYIQGFKWRIGYARMDLTHYIYEQMKGVRDGGGDGWVIWNANNSYGPSFLALEMLFNEEKQSSKITNE